MAKEKDFLSKWTDVLNSYAQDEHISNIKWNEQNIPTREIVMSENQVMGIWTNPISGYWYGYRYTKGIYQQRSLMQVPPELWHFIVENEKRIKEMK
jgi:hypothetical protein